MAYIKLTKAQYDRGTRLAKALKDTFQAYKDDVEEFREELATYIADAVAEIRDEHVAKVDKAREAFREWCSEHLMPTGEIPDGPWNDADSLAEELTAGVDESQVPDADEVQGWIGDWFYGFDKDEFEDFAATIKNLPREFGEDEDED